MKNILKKNFDRNAPKTPPVEVGIDLTEFYMSVEWDILEVIVNIIINMVNIVNMVFTLGACYSKCEVLHLLR